MAMLAGPRRKQKVVNLRAKNSSWSNDSGKFGQRMLEKMGWSSGKGLGAKENGIVEHVVARYKNDEKGLGYEDKNDQWTKHEDDFDALLANLSNSEKKEDQLHSGISLEVKSKTSKARIHYHKYTRGKDLSKYSEKDLANIFGKKSLKTEKVEEPSKSNVDEADQKFSVKGSMEDYFKSKISSQKNSSKKLVPENECNYAFQGFSNTNNEQTDSENDHAIVNFQPFSFYAKNDTNNMEKKNDTCLENKQKLKKKKNKVEIVETTENAESCETSQVKTKKSKKQKVYEDKSENIVDDKQIKKSKKRKHIESEPVITPTSELVDTCEPVKLKKKKKKNKNNE